MCELGLFVTIEEPAGTGDCFVTITLDDGQVVASDRIESKGAALGFCDFVICAMRLHDPAALIVLDVAGEVLDLAVEADLTASEWPDSRAASGSMRALRCNYPLERFSSKLIGSRRATDSAVTRQRMQCWGVGERMFWFGIGCTISGLAIGWLLRFPVFVAWTSFQTVLFTLALALAGELSGMAAFIWALAGLFFHQGAYLAGAIMRVTIEGTSSANPRHSVSAEIDEELSGIDRVATRVASQAPQLRPEAAILSHLASQLRRTLNDQRDLEALLRERRSGSGWIDRGP